MTGQHPVQPTGRRAGCGHLLALHATDIRRDAIDEMPDRESRLFSLVDQRSIQCAHHASSRYAAVTGELRQLDRVALPGQVSPGQVLLHKDPHPASGSGEVRGHLPRGHPVKDGIR
jgi:hypothetical protein